MLVVEVVVVRPMVMAPPRRVVLDGGLHHRVVRERKARERLVVRHAEAARVPRVGAENRHGGKLLVELARVQAPTHRRLPGRRQLTCTRWVPKTSLFEFPESVEN